MAKLLKLRRGTTSQHSSFTGAEGELTVDTTKDTAVVHDGSTAGGRPLLREDLDNMPASGVSAGTYGSSSAIPALTVDVKGRVTGATTTAIDSTAITNGTSNVSVATNGNVTIVRSGDTTFTADSAGTIMPDGKKARFGNSGDLQIYHQGNDSRVEVNNTGNLILNGNEVVLLSNNKSEYCGRFISNGAVQLYYDGSRKLETVSNGAKVNGTAEITGDINLAGEMNFMGGSDGTKYMDVRLGSSAFSIRGTSGGDTGHEDLAKFIRNGGVELYYDNTKKFDTTAQGATVTGTLTATTFEGDGVVPAGAILLWSGAANAVPTGYVLCNGSNSTPNLQNRFFVGAGDSYAVDATGGTNYTTIATTNLPSHTHSTGNHSHGVNDHSHSTPNHSHGVNSHTHSTPNHSHGVNSHSHSTPNHNHNMNSHSHSGNTSNTGGHSHNTTFYNASSGGRSGPNDAPDNSRRGNSFNRGTSNTGNHNHSFNTGNAASNTNTSGGGNTGNAGANTSNSGGSNTGGAGANTSTSGGSNTGNAGANTSAVSAGTTGSTGGGTAIENRPLYYALCYIMKT